MSTPHRDGPLALASALGIIRRAASQPHRNNPVIFYGRLADLARRLGVPCFMDGDTAKMAPVLTKPDDLAQDIENHLTTSPTP